MSVNPRFPLYIVSKGRADSRLTAKSLEAMGVPYSIVIEEQDYDDYAAVIDPKKIVLMDLSYKEKYDCFDDLGLTKSTGPGPARNFVWDHSIKRGFDWHWVMDDNINGFYRLNKNLKVPVGSGGCFRAMEDFCLRYTNVAMAGPNYHMFAPRKTIQPPFKANTRIYSCNLIRNDTPFRWRGRYNEDTDLSLRMLKEGWCTILFNAFLQYKVTTQVLGGGNTAEFYAEEGTHPKSEMQVRMHPDVSKMAWRFGRVHHYVDYSPFKKNKLIRRADFQASTENNEYGMTLKKKEGGRRVSK